jgi:hypothetical protein
MQSIAQASVCAIAAFRQQFTRNPCGWCVSNAFKPPKAAAPKRALDYYW